MGESADEDFRSVLFLDNWGSKKAQAPPRKSLRENIKRRRPTSELARGSLTRGWNCGGFFAWALSHGRGSTDRSAGLHHGDTLRHLLRAQSRHCQNSLYRRKPAAPQSNLHLRHPSSPKRTRLPCV